MGFRGEGKEEDGNLCQIVRRVSRHCPLFQRWIRSKRSRLYHVTYMSPESPENEMIHLLVEDVRCEVVKEIKDVKILMFSVSENTTPVLSRKDQLAVVCRYVNEDGQTVT